jgi:hypothetical protein
MPQRGTNSVVDPCQADFWSQVALQDVVRTFTGEAVSQKIFGLRLTAVSSPRQFVHSKYSSRAQTRAAYYGSRAVAGVLLGAAANQGR